MGQDKFKNFVLVGTQRSGTSVLAEQIGMHPYVACGWEWTESVRVFRKLSVTSDALAGDYSTLPGREKAHMQSIMKDEIQWIGFRRLFGASNKWLVHPRFSAKLVLDRFEDHLRYFSSRPTLHIIHVTRDDHLGWLRSKYVAGVTRSFVGQEYPEDITVHIPEKEALARLQAKKWVDERLVGLRKTNSYLQIQYSEISEDLPLSTERVFSFLGLEPTVDPVKGDIKKQATRSDSEYISNYDALRRYLNRHGF